MEGKNKTDIRERVEKEGTKLEFCNSKTKRRYLKFWHEQRLTQLAIIIIMSFASDLRPMPAMNGPNAAFVPRPTRFQANKVISPENWEYF
jgi:hypothetical protein